MSELEISNRVKERLLKECSSEQEGTWQILGEDPNCDWGGHHSQPDLGTVTGRYRDVVEYALTLRDFIHWGYGGNIKLIKQNNIKNIPKGFTTESLKSLHERKDKLQKELLEVEDKIKNLDVDYE